MKDHLNGCEMTVMNLCSNLCSQTFNVLFTEFRMSQLLSQNFLITDILEIFSKCK